ncbi:hypothetical protein D9M72_513360 [compost metagenome]
MGSDEPSTLFPDRARADERKDPPKRRPVRLQTRAKRLSAPNIDPGADVEYGDGNHNLPLPPMTFSDEVSTLDKEIRQLRRQLAEKLSLQNAQLKKLSERY